MPNDPTTRPVDFHDWLLWRERQKDRPFTDLDPTGAELYQLACDELYALARDGIVEITGSAKPAGLIVTWPAVIPLEELKRRRLITTHVAERHGAYVVPKQVPILVPRVPGAGPAYDGLTFRLAEPAAFDQYLDDLRPPKRVSHEELVDLLLEYQERPTEGEFHKAALERFRPPDYLPIGRAAMRAATQDEKRVAARFGSIKDGRPPKK